MRLTIIAIGSRGDVQPYVALGVGLQQAGHQVCVATHSAFEELVRSRGLRFFSLGPDPRQVGDTKEGITWLNSGKNQIQFIRYFIRVMQPWLEETMEEAWNASQGAEAIIYSRLGVIGYHVAERLGIPSFWAPLQPLSRTRSMSCDGVELPAWLPFQGQFNELSFFIVEQVFWQPFREQINKWRQAHGMAPMPWLGPYRQMADKHQPILYGFSPSVVPKPPDWGSWVHVNGYWFLDRLPDWQPPARLVDFITSGPPPIAIGFGSMKGHDSEPLLDIIKQTLSHTGQRAVLLTGWSGIRDLDGSDDIYAIEEVPHDWLFPLTSVTVHHGGAGTTAAGLRAGIPSIIVPYFADQGSWGQRVVKLGVGPNPVPRKLLTAENLAAAIEIATQDTAMRARAAVMARRIQSEDGVGKAVAAFHQHMNML